jgi:hypothetical protein
MLAMMDHRLGDWANDRCACTALRSVLRGCIAACLTDRACAPLASYTAQPARVPDESPLRPRKRTEPVHKRRP